jgi:hypothetical protein
MFVGITARKPPLLHVPRAAKRAFLSPVHFVRSYTNGETQETPSSPLDRGPTPR